MQLSDIADEVHQVLVVHYGHPEWRNPLPAIDELISTILSQNTNDNNRDRAFNALREKFPSWEAVRDANPDKVIDAIRSAGLANRKGPRIQSALKTITNELRGQGSQSLNLEFLGELSTEQARNWLIDLNGVGPKTAAIVLLFSLNRPAFPVDTHVYRVTGRIGLIPKKMSVEKAHKHLEDVFSPDSYYAVHLNLIRLGREICRSRNPKCGQCPLSHLCEYNLGEEDA